jgi:arylsulfatase A-like enzyme
MTGVRPSTSGVYDNQTCFRETPILKNAVTIPQHFRNHGYDAFQGGKIFHWPDGEFSDSQSWTSIYSTAIGTPAPVKVMQHGIDWEDSYKKVAWDWAPIEVPKEETQDWITASKAGDLLMKKNKRPFFLACGIFRPHFPLYAPLEFFDMHPLNKIILPKIKKSDLCDIPQIGKELVQPHIHDLIVQHNQWEKVVQAYLACISYADACVGHLLDALEKSPHQDNTVVVLWGDNGWHLGEKEHWAKITLWEEANHCPLIISVPGLKAQGTRCKHPVSLVDLYPTLNDLCGLPQRPELEGRSLEPLINEPESPWPHPAVMTCGYQNHAIRSHKWTYIKYKDGAEELYDFEKDPYEWKNRANKKCYGRIKNEMSVYLPKINTLLNK